MLEHLGMERGCAATSALTVFVSPRKLAEQHGLDMLTPSISRLAGHVALLSRGQVRASTRFGGGSGVRQRSLKVIYRRVRQSSQVASRIGLVRPNS